MGNAPDTVKRLVDRFDHDRKIFLSGDCKEEQLRASTQAFCLEPCLPESQSLT
jgi:hypothetical protein